MNTLKHRGGSRVALFVAGVVIALFGAVAGGVGTVSAHHVNLEARVDCSYVVYWTASTWNSANNSGENAQVDVSYQVDGAGPSFLLGSGAFTPGSHSFSGSFTFPEGKSTVVITSVSGAWGNGADGGTNSVTVNKPGECDPQTSPPTLPPTSPPTLPPTSPPTTVGATTTSEVASELPTTATQLVSETPTTTTVRSLPPTGSRSGSMQLVALGLLLIGLSLVLTARRRIA